VGRASLTTDQAVRIASAWFPHTLAEMASGGKWKPYPYLRFMSETLAGMIRKGGARVIVNVPPRHGKSELLCRWLPAWFLENWPEKRIIAATHGSELANSHGRWVRNEIAFNEYFTVKLRDDSTAANRWNTPEGGGMLCAGVGKGIMGFGGDLLLLDDPYPDWKDAYSMAYRRTLLDWFIASFTSRAEPNASIVILHQRMHPDDLSAILLREEPGKWTHINLPAIAVGDDPMGRAVGEALCPERYDLEALEQIRTGELDGDHKWQAMYQQAPKRIASGAAYAKFSPQNMDGSLDYVPASPLQISFDFNINPGMHAIVGQYHRLTDEFVTVDEVFAPRLDLLGCLRKLQPIIKRHQWPAVEIYGDATGSASSSTTGQSQYDTIRAFLHSLGIEGRFMVARSNPPIIDRVAALNDAMQDVTGKRHYRVHPRCAVLIRDYENVLLDAQGSIDKTDGSLTHASDCEGYRVYYQRRAGRIVRESTSRFSVRC